MTKDLNKYQRQTNLKSFGSDNQLKLSKSKVLIVGCGGLGIPVAQYLNAMGVGAIGLMDSDTIALHNLHRQVLFDEEDVGRKKVVLAAEKLRQQNTQTEIRAIDHYLTKENALDIVSGYDLVVDATDNFSTRYLINDSCVILDKPFVYGALHDFEGQVSVFNHKGGPTYRCLFPTMPRPEEIPNCDENGVLGVLPGIIGTLQALEAVKVLTGIGEVLSGKLLIFNGLTHQNRLVQFKPIPSHLKIVELSESYHIPHCQWVNTILASDFMLLAENRQLIDVRSEQEFDDHHLDRAKNIPIGILEEKSGDLDFTRPIYFICQTGKRSAIAIEKLQSKRPWATLYQVEGGMNEIMAQCQ